MSDNREHTDAHAKDMAVKDKRDVTREDAIAAADTYGAAYTEAMENRKKHRNVLTVLGIIVAFATAFALMLPAIGVTKEVVEETAGIELQESPADASLSAQAPEPAVATVVETAPVETPAPAPEVAEVKEDKPAASDNDAPASADVPANDNNAGADDNTADVIEPDNSDEPDESDSSKSAEKTPAQTFKEELLDDRGKVKLTVTVDAPEGAFPEGTKMEISEIESDEIADKVEAAIEDDPAIDGTIKSMTAVDIRFIDKDGNEIEPAKNVDVRITSAAVADIEEPILVHVIDKEKDSAQGKDVDAEVVKKVDVVDEQAADDTLEFKTNEFSPYVIVEMESLTTQVITAAGETYNVTVAYGSEAGIPEGAELVVSEILGDDNVGDMSYDEYIARAEEALGLESDTTPYIRLFDIKIVDAAGEKVEIAAPVDVTIELADDQDESDAQVVHFADGADTGEIVKNVEAETDAVSFVAEGFSAYAIVVGPAAIPYDWHKVESIGQFQEMVKDGQGFYIGHTKGYYFSNALTSDSKRTGITKTKPPQSYPPTNNAAMYYFEPAAGENQYYAYCYAADGTTKQYVFNGGNNSLSFTNDAKKTAFTVSADGGVFTLNNGAWYWNMQGGDGGARFCSWNSAGDENNNMNLWYYSEVPSDPYNLDGLSYGLMNWSGSVAGKAMMANAAGNSLNAMALTVMTKNNNDKLFAPNDSDITMWTFHWAEGDRYYLTAVVGGSTKYLRIDESGLSLVSATDDNCKIQVVPGTGIHENEICLVAGNTTLTYSGSVETGFTVNGEVGNEWLYLVDLSELTSDYFRSYSASKVSVSDPTVTNGSKVIVYTRSWNEKTLQYDYYAIGSDGSLVQVFESGDSIEWVEGQVNTLLWNFVEYYWEDTGEPNYYYDLYNQYSEKYIAPQVTGGQVLSGDTIGINLNGRRDGQYYSSILAWDEANYSYVGLKVENGQIVTCPKSEAADFYFAELLDLNVDDTLTTVPTVDSTQYGITMKLVDIGTRAEMSNFLDDDTGGLTTNLVQGLLSTNLGEDDYPTAVGGSLGSLFSGAQEVNHLFIQSTYSGTGYFEYDSAENFASLQGKTGGDFAVYKELGSYDNDQNGRNTLKHGQFFPFNDLKAGVFTSVNKLNQFATTGKPDPLPADNPRRNERLYSIEHDGQKPDYYFGMELEATFTQTPSGLDAWGHDIIFEFTGDDDFWLYVDGELVIDLGGIHSAVPGSVNFRTGDVNVNGKPTTLRDLFYNNYKGRGHTDAEAQAYVDGIFEQNGDGQWVFKDNTNHTMRIFYFERGAGASNLHMRFNLAAVKKGTVQLSKELSGVDSSESVRAEFPYQIYYKTSEEEGAQEQLLTNMRPNDPAHNEDYVLYKDTVNPVKYKQEFVVGGVTYNDVFLLKPGETAEISFPEGMTSYRIVECGVNTSVYNSVTVNGDEITGTPAGEGRADYGIGYATTDGRAKVNYVNRVNPDALRTLTFTKKLFKEDGVTPINFPDDLTTFTFRLYLATEFEELDVANMHTYHVKDQVGNYCAWNAALQKFEVIGDGITDYSQLTAEQKVAASFTTSIYGTISRIPVDYTVEVRNVLAGTQFRVQERPKEVPDGYTFQKYMYGTSLLGDAVAGVTDTVVASVDPHVDICNLKGWGLRVNKVWSDADYMSERGSAYFAVFIEAAGGDLTLVDGSVRELAYGANPQSLYWFWKTLPVPGADFNSYVIREVVLTGGNITVGKDGTVTGYDTVDPVADGNPISISGKQKGETEDSELTYTVTYKQGQIEKDSNVRVDAVTNSRPGIVLKKAQWDGTTPLEGATFTLTDNVGNNIGTFTSDDTGLITVAFLRKGVEYTLTETKAPQGWQGLDAPMTIKLVDDVATVGGVRADYYVLGKEDNDTPSVTIKDRPYTFQAIKRDGDTGEPLAGVKFALHRQVTVDGVTTIDLNPMPGYENLVTDASGVIPGLDETLPSGVYELRETDQGINGYQALSTYIRFVVGPTGMITMGAHPDGVKLDTTLQTDGAVAYEMSIPNYKPRTVSVWKTDMNYNVITTGASFALYSAADYDENAGAVKSGATPICTGSTDSNGIMPLGALAAGDYRLIETDAPAGYYPAKSAVKITVTLSDVRALHEGNKSLVIRDGDKYYVDGQPTGTYQVRVWNSSGYELPNTGGPGIVPLYVLGLALIAGAAIAMIRQRAKAQC